MTVRDVALQVVTCAIGLLAVWTFLWRLVAMGNNMADKVCLAGESVMAVGTLVDATRSSRSGGDGVT